MNHPIEPDARPTWLIASLAGFIAFALAFIRLGLWHHSLSAPVSYWGDALYENVLVKALTEQTWNYHISRLGAPFGMDAVDFPIGCSLDLAIVKLLSVVIVNPFLLINLYWLLTIGLAAAFATLLFRGVAIKPMWAAICGVLYGILPWTFYRNIGHLNLVHFIVPAAAYLGLCLALEGPAAEANTKDWFRRNLLIAIPICCAVGLTYIYWAFFACIVVAIGGLIGFFRTKSRALLGTALIYIAVIGLFAIVDISATLAYWHSHGANAALNYKRIGDADVYALKIRQLLLPIEGHPLPLLRKIRNEVTGAGWTNDNNETAWSSLGLIGSAGFLVLAAVAVLRPRNSILGDHRMKVLSGFVIALILVGQLGGFGSLFNVFVMHEFRCYTRLSPFISVFCLGAIGLILDQLLSEKPIFVRASIAAVALLFGAFDQIPATVFPWADQGRQFYDDRRFIRDLESRLPAGLSIFQLPHTGFPLDGMHERMKPYDNARAYLQSRTLRWSWGSMDGRHDDWPKKTVALPVPEFLERLTFAGFGGILLDRWGYADREQEEAIAHHLGATALPDQSGRWVFFDLRQFRTVLMRGLAPAEIADRQELALDAASMAIYRLGQAISFGKSGAADRFQDTGWSGTEERMTWTEGKSAVLMFGRLPRRSLKLTITTGALVKPPRLPAQPVVVCANGHKIADWTVDQSKDYSARIPAELISRAGSIVIELRIPKAVSPKSLGINGDQRVLGLCVSTVTLQLDSSDG